MGNRTVRHPQHLKKIKRKKFNGKVSAGSRPSDKGGGGGGHPDPEIRGRGPVSKKYFWNWNDNEFVHSRSSSKTKPDSRPKWSRFISFFRPKRRQNPPLGEAHTYMAYIRDSSRVKSTIRRLNVTERVKLIVLDSYWVRPRGYCHIWPIEVCAAVKGMVFKQFTLGWGI